MKKNKEIVKKKNFKEDIFNDWINNEEKSIISDNKYEHYISLSVIFNVHNVLKWWLKSTQRHSFSCLLRMTINIFCISAQSSEAEQLFSSAKQIYSDDRNRLSVEFINAIECIKNWIQKNVS